MCRVISLKRSSSAKSSMIATDELSSVAIKLNNLGVDLLLNQDEKRALLTFHKAIHSMKLAMKLSIRYSQGNFSCSGSEYKEPLLEYQNLLLDNSSLTHQSSNNACKYQQKTVSKLLLPEEDNNDMVYAQPIKIDPLGRQCLCESDGRTTETEGKAETAIILYNTALSYQISAIKNGQSDILVKSLKLYDMVYQSISDVLPEVSSNRQCAHKKQRRELCLLLLLASLNNAAMVYHQSGKQDDANKVFDRMLEITCRIRVDEIQGSDVDFFVMNAISYEYQRAAPSA